MNKVIMMGRLTRDPDIRVSNGEGTTVARFTVAVDRRGRKREGQPEADFIGCVAFGRTAEFAEKYLGKGIKILVTGRLQTGSYQNKEGNKVYTTDVVVEDVEFCEKKQDSESVHSAAPPEKEEAKPDPEPEQLTLQGAGESYMLPPGDAMDAEAPMDWVK